jgi:CheY-like chemotaxis protein
MNNLSAPVILVIDANALSLTATSAALNCQHYDVLCAQNSKSAFEVCKRISLDLIVCDVALQRENDGYDLIQQIKQMPEVADVPVVFVSAGQASDVISRSTGNGTAYHLKKPFNPQELFDLIEKALWLPHLVKSHINKPHIPLSPNSNKSTSNTQINN